MKYWEFMTFSLQLISDLKSFIASLRPICEVLFNFLLVAYCAGLRVSCDRLSKERESWDHALKFAEDALDGSQAPGHRGDAMC